MRGTPVVSFGPVTLLIGIPLTLFLNWRDARRRRKAEAKRAPHAGHFVMGKWCDVSDCWCRYP